MSNERLLIQSDDDAIEILKKQQAEAVKRVQPLVDLAKVIDAEITTENLTKAVGNPAKFAADQFAKFVIEKTAHLRTEVEGLERNMDSITSQFTPKKETSKFIALGEEIKRAAGGNRPAFLLNLVKIEDGKVIPDVAALEIAIENLCYYVSDPEDVKLWKLWEEMCKSINKFNMFHAREFEGGGAALHTMPHYFKEPHPRDDYQHPHIYAPNFNMYCQRRKRTEQSKLRHP